MPLGMEEIRQGNSYFLGGLKMSPATAFAKWSESGVQPQPCTSLDLPPSLGNLL